MKLKQTPLISIILPVHNATGFLVECLNSIKNQTYSNWELIAINDGSKDNSLSILKAYARQEKRIKVFSYSKRKGIAFALNLAISKSKGDYLARMDADDIMCKDRLESQIKYLLHHSEVVVLGTQCTLIDTQGRTIGTKSFPTTQQKIISLMFLRSPLQHPAIMINKTKVPKDFVWYFTSRIPAEDLDLYFRLLPYGKLVNLPQKLLKYRLHSDNLSLRNPKKTFFTAQKVRWNHLLTTSYWPGFLPVVLNICITAVFSLLPSSAIYPLYSLTLKQKRSLSANPTFSSTSA